MKVVTDDMTPRERSLAKWIERLLEARLPTKALRDEFAMAALTGLLSNPNFDVKPGLEKERDQAYAEDAYSIDDAMLEAREVKDERD
jgi:hypothetical protein